MSEKKFGCMIFEDQFERLDRVFDDSALGRVIRAAFRKIYYGEENALEDGKEWYACDELTTSFERNKTILDQSSIDGKIGNAIKYAKNEEDFKQRISGIEGLTSHDQYELLLKFRDRKK